MNETAAQRTARPAAHHPRRRMARAAIALTAAMSLSPVIAACGVDHGTVISKDHLPAEFHWELQPLYRSSCSGNGAKLRCRLVQAGSRLVPDYTPECWQLTLRAKNGDTGTTCVKVSTYEHTRIGDYR